MNSIGPFRFVLCLAVIRLFAAGCTDGVAPHVASDGGSAVGQAGGVCFPNQTCFVGLTCISDICLRDDSVVVDRDGAVPLEDGLSEGGRPDMPPPCEDPPCRCIEGETVACANIGECREGNRQCVDGEYGPCQWTQGPQAESCDGKDNDCDGSADETADLVAPPCNKQKGVCAGAQMTCGGAAGWTPCNDAQYKAHASNKGAAYEIEETSCDQLDNDCDGQIDEITQCCQPDCSGAVCGANDGCGGICTSGPCDANESCSAGVCGCTYLACDGACCGPGQLCQALQCTTPPVTSGWTEVMPKVTTTDLKAVWGASATDVWAVGNSGTVLHFDGSKWNAVFIGLSDQLRGIHGCGKNDVWVVGQKGAGAFTESGEPVVAHFDGQTWSTKGTNLSNDFYLNDIWCTSANDVWGAGPSKVGNSWVGGTIAHYDGNTWTVVKKTTGRVRTIWAASAKSVWAFGDTSTYYHYDGQKWTETSKGGQGVYRYDVWGFATDDFWTVGDTNSTGSPFLSHYNGLSFTSYPPPASDRLYAVWGPNSNSVYAAGALGYIFHYDGQGWTLSRNRVTGDSAINGIWGSNTNDVWAVGDGGVIYHKP